MSTMVHTDYKPFYAGGTGPGAKELGRLERGQLLTTVLSAPPGVQVQAVMKCSPRKIFDLLTDYESLPRHIYGLESAEVLRRNAGTASVRFTMKLPFPVGTISWTNIVTSSVTNDNYTIEWTLIDGDLNLNDGQLRMTQHRGASDQTYAEYQVRVESCSRLPKSAERLATRWLVPKIVGKLRVLAEKQ